MIILWILLALVGAFALATLVVGTGNMVKRDARKIVDAGVVTDLKKARHLHRSLGTAPAELRDPETDELYQELGRLIKSAEMASQTKATMGFRGT